MVFKINSIYDNNNRPPLVKSFVYNINPMLNNEHVTVFGC